MAIKVKLPATMTIRVTKEDIRLGRWKSSSACPIARALKRKFKGCYPVVEFFYIKINGDRYGLPKEAINFIRQFDDKRPVKPFSFQIT